VVFVMDADPEPPSSENATLLVDWPVQASHPRRCAFVYSESRCPPELAGPLTEEQQARRREELNGLYVAMTRARRRLVFSATAPLRRNPAQVNWWPRVEGLGSPWPAPAGEGGTARREPGPTIEVLPRWTGSGAAPPAAASAADSPASRLGSAVHRLLEWHTGSGGDLTTLADAAAAAFGAPAQEIARIAGRILASADCARFFDPELLGWAGNEVPVSLAGAVQRIDRLVLLDEGGTPTWWVLDYKLQHRPQDLAEYHTQLAGYRAAVQAAQPGTTVRSAFIAGDGSLIESG
jgi:ATP-dependent helicase/nuclease subunit A